MDNTINGQEEEELKKNVLSRMRRIEGQVRGIQRMMEEGKDCEDVLIQVRAVRSALQSASKLILKRYMIHCQTEAAEAIASGESREESLEKFVDVLTNFLDG